MTAKKLSPMQARTEKQILSLQSDNTGTKEFWMLIDGMTVTLAQQTLGESCKKMVSIPRSDFHKLLRWYMRPQKTTPWKPQA